MGREDGDGGPVVYEIRVAERVSDRWSAWFGGMALDPLPDGGTVMRGSVVDQAQLHGILDRIRDMHLTLLLVRRVRTRHPRS